MSPPTNNTAQYGMAANGQAPQGNALTSNQRLEALFVSLSGLSRLVSHRQCQRTCHHYVGGCNTGMMLSIPSSSTLTPRIDSIAVRPQRLVLLSSMKNGDLAERPIVNRLGSHPNLHSPSWAEEKLMLVFGMDMMGGGLREEL